MVNDSLILLTPATDPYPVGGRLQHFWRAWAIEDIDSWVTQALQQGYKIPFARRPPLISAPPAFHSYSPGSDRYQALDAAVQAMLTKEAVEII